MSNSYNDRMNINEIIKKLKQGESIPASENEVNNFIIDNLSEGQADAVKNILSDEQKTRALLNSDAARELFHKFFGGKQNG